MAEFQVISKMKPQGDQPAAIERLCDNFLRGQKHNVLLGVTGSGKTFTMAHVVERLRKPTLVVSHNKTLAAQLYEEFKGLFPNNAVEYFVSYYDYYQPEAYIPQRDIYIEKDSSRNDDLDRLRLSATTSLSHRRDVIIVASVSCIFGLGSPEEYQKMVVPIRCGMTVERDELLKALVALQYDRNDVNFKRGTFRVRGDTLDIYPAYEEFGYQVELFGETIDAIRLIHPTSGETLSTTDQVFVFPAVHYVADESTIERAVKTIRVELENRLIELRNQGKLLEAQRLSARTRYDIEMLVETGTCPGIENYSRHLDGRTPGQRPYTLIDYFGEDFLLIVDESHVTLPQLRAMYNGDRSRKEVLVEHGFRLPSALDNRPLRFEEFQELWRRVMFVSATPGAYELELSGGEVVEQVIRPTGLVDPAIEVRPARGQVGDLLQEIRHRVAKGERTLITTLTKRLAEDLAEYGRQEGFRCKYLHSEIDTLERVEILRDLREGKFDVLVGVNLLREGLDLPEVSLVAILDADKEGFLRSATSLIQTIGRCARNVNAQVFLYGDTVSPAMRQAIDETRRRREIQLEYNRKHKITPTTIQKAITSVLTDQLQARKTARAAIHADEREFERTELVAELEREMLEAAEALEFERAAALRDRIAELTGKDAEPAKSARR
ncbi:MAG: UvrABC system protein B [Planctomycetes bacterium ADurb.Bin126]|nr:MAG: UvrABC system protein B [Planctomycetes bacterium ADurb.Bin126]HOD81542.1 excinuclease ABC subunit UvrB [Phycisphaerae bacterium]HQL76386.1 excinuclease ABC subunit UvrB [Phycisphaerae bacterium]